MYNFTIGAHNEQLNVYIDGLWAQEKRAKSFGMAGVGGALRYEYAENRRITVERITESFYAAVKKMPAPAQLDRLASYLLFDELTDSTPYKTRNMEYPFESEHKAKRHNDGLTSFSFAETVATDGRDYRTPYRRKRTPAENIYVDAIAGRCRDADGKTKK